MGTRTGRPRGRPKGAKNKRTAEREAAMKEMAAQIDQAVGGAFDDDAHGYLMSVYKDPLKPENLRIDLAAVIALSLHSEGPSALRSRDGDPLLVRCDFVVHSRTTHLEVAEPSALY